MYKITSTAVIFAMCTSLCACSGTTKADLTKGGQAFIDCMKVDIGQQVPGTLLTVLGLVTQIISQGNTDWKTQLENVGVQYGSDVEACAVKAVDTVFTGLAQAAGSDASGSASTSMTANQEALARAESFIQAKGYHFK